jgi:hypothetical protein
MSSGVAPISMLAAPKGVKEMGPGGGRNPCLLAHQTQKKVQPCVLMPPRPPTLSGASCNGLDGYVSNMFVGTPAK